MENQVDLIGFYDFREDVILVEMIIDEFPSEIDFGSFCTPSDMLDESNWQVAYMEQYLNLNGTEKLCETYDIPTEPSKPSRVVFFIFKTDAMELSTPYGMFSLKRLQELPHRLGLAKLIEFDEVD